MIKEKKRDYLKKYFNEHKKNSKKIWKGIRSALEWHKIKNSTITSVMDTDGTRLSDPKTIVQCFAKYFENIPKSTINKIPKGLGRPLYTSFLSGNYTSSMAMSPTS